MTDKEKAEYYDEWKDYFEPLARIRSGVVKALPHYKGYENPLAWVLLTDTEVASELENLIQTIINEIEDLEQIAPIQGG